MKRQLRQGTNVVYKGEIYRINSPANNQIVEIYSLKTNDRLTVKKSLLVATPHDNHDLIKYNKNYYIIKNIYCHNNIPVYEVDYPNKNYVKKNIIPNIHSNDPDIHNIPSELQEKMMSFLKFVDRYNTTISYLNKKTSEEYHPIENSNVETIMNELMIKCKFSINQLSKIEHTLKKTHNPDFQIHLLTSEPFGFITSEVQLITFHKAEEIAKNYNIPIEFKTKCEKWTYCLFADEKSFYIQKYKFCEKLEEFCKKSNKESSKYLRFLEKTIIIDKIIDGKQYKTTKYLLEMEQTMTNMMLDMYYEKEYDISEETILFEIRLFEEKRRLEVNKPNYSLEEEQIKSVIKSIQNKLSIITGFPGTGKTEIVCCITQVLKSLHKKNKNNIVTSNNRQDGNPFSEYEYNNNNDITDNDETTTENDTSDNSENDEESNTFVDPTTVGLIAPTGLAALNLKKSIRKGDYNELISGTCHKILLNTFQNIKTHKNSEMCNCKDKEKCKYKNLKIKCLVIDETSMLDTLIFYEILKMCEYFDTRLIIIGDINQLPSVGPGTVLKNLINSDCFYVTKLNKIKRQNAGALVETIKKMTTEVIEETEFDDDTMSILNIKDFYDKDKIELKRDAFLKLIQDNNLTQYNTKFITYFRDKKYLFNTNAINNLLQDIYNPDGMIIPSNNKYENGYVFKIDDKIIRTENDYTTEKMRANGEQAKITGFDGKSINIIYDDGFDIEEKIGINELHENFKLNYCTTIHSAQGSQYDNVIFFIQPGQARIIDKTCVYTGTSRAKNKCAIISKHDDFISCQKNVKNTDGKVSLFMRESNIYEL